MQHVLLFLMHMQTQKRNVRGGGGQAKGRRQNLKSLVERLFGAPHLIRAWSAYKHIRICSLYHVCTYTHTTGTCITGDGLVEWEEKKWEEKRWVVSFDLREWRQMPDRERKRVPDHRSSVIHIRGSHPPGPPAHPRSVEYPSIQGWAKRARRRAEMKQLREVWRSCTIVKCQSRDYFLLKPAADCSQWRLLS